MTKSVLPARSGSACFRERKCWRTHLSGARESRGQGFRLLVQVALAVLATWPAIGRALTPSERLTTTAQVWGLAKYRHPEVTACRRAWDQALVDALPGIEAAADDESFDRQVRELLEKAGPVATANPPIAPPDWITTAPLSAATKAMVAAIAANTPQRQCYVKPFFDTQLQMQFSQADFSADTGFNGAPLTRSVRLLGAFRFWNAAEYFFAYKELIGKPWDAVLREHVIALADAETPVAYAQAMRAFTAELKDSHGAISSAFSETYASPPFSAAYVERKAIVTAVLAQAGAVHPGDEVVSINGVDTETAVNAAMAYGSNPVARRDAALFVALGGSLGEHRYRLRRADGQTYEASFSASSAFAIALERGTGDSWQWLPSNSQRSCAAAVARLGQFQPADLAGFLDAARRADVLVLDSRHYPASAEAIVGLADALLPAPVSPAAAWTPSYSDPGTYVPVPESETRIGGQVPIGFQGRIVVLVNEKSISFSEFVAMIFQTQPKTRIFGSQSAGADGEVTEGLKLPAGIATQFSSNRISYPDGRPSQRIGIVPDVHVAPTIAGIQAQRDEVLEAALACRWAAEPPPPRRPRPGMYFDPSRSGEGIEVHQLGVNYAGIFYAYDDQGLPRWLLSTSTIDQGIWDSPLYSTSSTAPAVVAGSLNMDFQRGPYTPACAIPDQSGTEGRAVLTWSRGTSTQLRCLEPLIYSDGSPYSGHWAGPDTENGWGLSLHNIGDRLVVFLYAYDQQRQPRWLLGIAPWTGQREIVVPMSRNRGFCSTCEPKPVQTQDAGSITLILNDATVGSFAGNSVSVDVQFHDGSRWQRTRMPLRKL